MSKLADPLMKVAIPLAKNILVPLWITASTLAIDAGIQKKIHGSGTTTLIISNEEMNEIIKVVKALEDSHIFFEEVTKTIKNETKEEEGGFISMFLGTLGATISFIIFWDFLIFYQFFFSPQMKRCAIITYKHGLYKLSHKLPNDLILRIIGN